MVLILYTVLAIRGRFEIELQPLTARAVSISWADLDGSSDGNSDSDSYKAEGYGCQRNKDLHVGDFTDLERCGFSMQTEVGTDVMTITPLIKTGAVRFKKGMQKEPETRLYQSNGSYQCASHSRNYHPSDYSCTGPLCQYSNDTDVQPLLHRAFYLV